MLLPLSWTWQVFFNGPLFIFIIAQLFYLHEGQAAQYRIQFDLLRAAEGLIPEDTLPARTVLAPYLTSPLG